MNGFQSYIIAQNICLWTLPNNLSDKTQVVFLYDVSKSKSHKQCNNSSFLLIDQAQA